MTKIPLHNLFEQFFKLKGMDSVKSIDETLAMFKYDPQLKAEFDKFLKTLNTNLKTK